MTWTRRKAHGVQRSRWILSNQTANTPFEVCWSEADFHNVNGITSLLYYLHATMAAVFFITFSTHPANLHCRRSKFYRRGFDWLYRGRTKDRWSRRETASTDSTSCRPTREAPTTKMKNPTSYATVKGQERKPSMTLQGTQEIKSTAEEQ